MAIPPLEGGRGEDYFGSWRLDIQSENESESGVGEEWEVFQLRDWRLETGIEQGTRNKEQRTKNKEQRTRNKEEKLDSGDENEMREMRLDFGGDLRFPS